MTTSEHPPGPWQQDWHYIVAPDPNGVHPDIYIAEIAEEDTDGRIAPPEQREANGRLIVAGPALLAACRMVIDRWEQGDLAEAARACQDAVALATAGNPPWGIDFEAERQRKAAPALLAALVELIDREDIDSIIATPTMKRVRAAIAEATAGSVPAKMTAPPPAVSQPYSVLLLYPDYLDDSGHETYYAFVEAGDPLAAIAIAQQQAAEAQVAGIDDPTDFAPLLVTQGHHYGEPLFNK